jgi:hypothetical protein
MFVIHDIHDYVNSECIVFLSFHYAFMVSDEDIKSINEDKVRLNLIYRGDGKLEIG